MGKSKLLLVPLLIQFYLASLTHCQPNVLFQYCIDTYGNYTNTSTYKANLNTLLSSLTSVTQNDYGFYNISTGQDLDTVNSIALCRGDVTIQDCHKCLNDSTSELPQRCPTQKEAVLWYDNCMLRYSNRSILGISEEQHYFTMRNVDNMTDPNQFNPVLGNLLDSLQNQAASGNSEFKFATGEANVSSFQRVYALAQCSPDLSGLSCFNCLGDFIGKFPSCCANRKGARVVGPSCNIRYETYQFYTKPNLSLSPLSPPPASSPPLQSTTSSISTTGK